MPVPSRLLSIVILGTFVASALLADDFPLVGTYTENQICTDASSDSGLSRVKITADEIDSRFGLCTILSKKREGATLALHVKMRRP